jgi:phage terminase large subunit-like protein
MLRGLSDAEIATLYWHWDFWARPDQLPPVGDWSAWMMLGGRVAVAIHFIRLPLPTLLS